ncbi:MULTISPECIES: PilN domain-containing protein [Yersinia]|uniref:PilN domain-containing protein n=1 Tax=Yersinia TaxID=629 RepID=UPI0005EA59C3|nr:MULTISPECIES: PilN domain-containing protein [Yersinia]OVZ96812.1 pilus assembly protein PilN [Yersinia frederiksenii]RXA95865.1 pilus assembly protein PilN [Yersinia sp. 2105 StPb PI]CNI34682.1 type IV pilus biogenesis protein PilN [Yersinia frederiksenii]CNI58392.1 type IV pilus biogenesis protein PilN [Yersinia frederiksenii]CNK36343.1 type IV pilus biogenesis protein PilN [Yersinia frederiksenii]
MYQVNFSSWRTERQLTRYRFWRNIGLCQCTLFGLVLGGILMQSHKEHLNQQGRLAALVQQQNELSQHHQKVQQAMVQLQQAEQRLQFYRQVHQPARRYSTLLQQLSQQIPDSCWLVSVIPQSEKLIFEAISQDYAAINAFLVQLGRMPLLANVRLHKIIQQDDGNFRFVVRANWLDKGNQDE